MINLLDLPAKREMRAARLNVTLLTYCAIVVVALVCVGLLALFSSWWLTNRISGAQHQQSSNEAQTAGYDAVKAQAAAFSSNLSKIQAVLQNRSQYSTALLNIAASLPAGASVSTVALSPSFVATPLKLTATTPDYASALALKARLAASPIYAKVALDSANCSDGTNDKTGCDVSITATLNQSVFVTGAAE